MKQLGLGVVFFWFLIGGIAHFTFTDFEVRMVPPYIPWPYAVVIASGVFELIGAAGLLWKFTRRSAGIGLFLLTIAVTPANFYMLQHPERFDFPYWGLGGSPTVPSSAARADRVEHIHRPSQSRIRHLRLTYQALDRTRAKVLPSCVQSLRLDDTICGW